MQVAFVILTAEGLEGALAIDGLVHWRAGKADKGGVGQARHKEVAEITAGGAVRFVDENVDVRANIDIGRHIAELVNHRHNDAPVVLFQQFVKPGNAASVLQIAQAERGEVLEHLVFQLVAVDHQEDGRLICLGRPKKLFRRLDHGEGLAAPLGVPDKAPCTHGIEGAGDGRLHRAGLMLAQDVFVQLLVLFGKDNVLLQKGQHLRDGAEALYLRLQLANLLILPVENVPPHRVPAHPVGEADGIGGGEELLRYEQLRCLAVITADLVNPKSNRLILVGILALNHQHRYAVDEKSDILPSTVMTVVKGPLLGHFVHVVCRFIVINQDQIALAPLFVVEELAPVAQVLHKFPVAVNVGMEMAELPEQRPLGFGVARIELPHLGIEQIVEEERSVSGAIGRRHRRVKPAPPLGLFS